MSTRPELILRGDTRCAQLYRAILTESTLPRGTETFAAKDGTTLDPARGETAGQARSISEDVADTSRQDGQTTTA